MVNVATANCSLKRQPGLVRDDDGKPFSQYADEMWVELDFGPLFKIMEKTRNKPELRVFIKMCQEWVSVSRLSHRYHDFEYLYRKWYEHTVDHHRHEILKLLLHCRFSFECFMHFFRIACQYGCEICVKLILERSEEKLNQINKDRDELQRCFFMQYWAIKVSKKKLWICFYVVQKKKARIFHGEEDGEELSSQILENAVVKLKNTLTKPTES